LEGGGAESKMDQPGGGRVPLAGRGILNPRVPSPPIAPGPSLALELLSLRPLAIDLPSRRSLAEVGLGTVLLI
jgi:hypothetical protein